MLEDNKKKYDIVRNSFSPIYYVVEKGVTIQEVTLNHNWIAQIFHYTHKDEGLLKLNNGYRQVFNAENFELAWHKALILIMQEGDNLDFCVDDLIDLELPAS